MNIREISEEQGSIAVLISEETPGFSASCVEKLNVELPSIRVDVVGSAGDFMDRFAAGVRYDVVIAEPRLHQWSAMSALHWMASKGVQVPLILIADVSRTEFVTNCIQAGAADYVLKNELERLPVVIRRVLNERDLRVARDRAEQELRDSEKQYRLLFESNPNPMWVCDVEDFRFLAVNEAAVRHYGYSREEFLSMTVADVHPEEVPFLERQGSVTTLKDDSWSREVWKHVKKNGVAIDVEISSQPIAFRGRKAVLVMAHDVTAILRAEHALRDNREQLQSLLDSSAEAIFGVDLNGVCTFCNAAGARMLGYDSAAALVGSNVHSITHNSHPVEECTNRRCSLACALCLGVPVQGTDDQFTRFDGSRFTVEYWCHPVVREGVVVGSVLTFFDISQKRKAEEALRRTEAQYMSIIQGSPYGIYRADSADRLLMANPALVAMLGYESEDELLHLKSAAAFYRHPEESVCRGEKYFGGGDVFDGESTLIRKDKSHVTVRLKARRLHSDQEEQGYEVFVENVTEKRHLERQLMQSQKMEAIGHLAGGVAHDFNNLLMVVNSFAELILNSPFDPAIVRHHAAQIYDAGSKAAAVTKQLLAFSRSQVQDLKLLDLNAVVEDWRGVLPRLLGEAVEMVFAFSAHPVFAYADRGQMEQVVMNLALNARDAMPSGGRVTIATERMYLDQVYFSAHDVQIASGYYVMLSVADTGCGMDATTRVKVFEPFFTTKARDKGTGLGLSTVYGIVKQSGGFIWVYSEPNHGSIFKVYLPEAQNAARPVPRSENEVKEARGSETILVVDDEPGICKVTSAYLRNQGYTVLQASNPVEALAILKREGEVDLVLTDMMMPEGSGPDLAKAIKDLGWCLPVVFMSGYADHSVKPHRLGHETIYLQKPFTMRKLSAAIRTALDRTPKFRLNSDVSLKPIS